jgi:hypothetical protein
MKTHAKAKRRSPRGRHATASAAHRFHKPAQTHRKHGAVKSAIEAAREGTDVSRLDEEEKTETFTPMETGRPDRDEGEGPLGQEGEGEAQNDQLAALEGLEPQPIERDIPETWS